MSFGKAFLSSCLGALTALLLFCFIVVFLISGLVSGIGSDKDIVLEEKSVLHLKLDAQISELQHENPFAGLPVPGGDVKNIGLLQLKEAISHAKNDDKIKGIYIDVSYPSAGFSTIAEIRESLIDFRKSGKWVLAYGEVMSEGAYYLASAADKIYLNPEGQIEFNGLVAEVTFFKKMFEKLEIEPEIFRVGEFKSAVEPFLFEKMSPESRLQLDELLNSLYGQVLADISAERNIPTEKLKNLSDNMLVRNADEAIANGMIDSLMYRDGFNDVLKSKLDVAETKDINMVTYNKYRKSFSNFKSSKNEIAVIVADGTITPGEQEGSDQFVAGETFVEEIRRAREDDDIKAIVIRVNSPGGEFRASDMMWREVDLATKTKPVIASMGDVAASGGYYLAMACDTIVSQPNTITGSIGIFSMLFNAKDFLQNKLGITFDEERTGNFGETYTITRPLTPEEKRFLQKDVEEIYETFTSKAAQGRNMQVDDIKKVASGRVWSGEQAKERGLVDVLGGFNDAVSIAAAKAGVSDDYKLKFYPREKPFFQEIMTQLEENSEAKSMKSTLGNLYPYYLQFRKLQSYQGMQARLPYEMKIH
jgi:protease IV